MKIRCGTLLASLVILQIGPCAAAAQDQPSGESPANIQSPIYDDLEMPEDFFTNKLRCYRAVTPYATPPPENPDLANIFEIHFLQRGSFVAGVINYLPAEKDSLTGVFAGTITIADKSGDRSTPADAIKAQYKWTQEGEIGETPITITLTDKDATVLLEDWSSEYTAPTVDCGAAITF